MAILLQVTSGKIVPVVQETLSGKAAGMRCLYRLANGFPIAPPAGKVGRHAETCQATDAKVQGLLRCPRQALQAADVVGGLARPVAAPAAAAATAAGQQLLRRDGGGLPPAAWRGTAKTKHLNSVDAARSQADCVCINHFTLGVGGKLTAWETDQFPNPLIFISYEKAIPPEKVACVGKAKEE